MNKSYNPTSRWQWVWMSIPLMLVLLVLALSARAQQGSRGNTFVGNGGNMTLFGAHNFLTGGDGTQPGIIGTARTATVGMLNFGPSATYTGANDANHVDGYVRKYGAGQFVFPTGDNGHYGPFAAVADATNGAYFFVDPNSAITSSLGGGTYAPLPAGAPFSTTSKASSLSAVSTKEYWDINGTTATAITLVWSASSTIGTLTSSDLSKLTIAGWNGTQWVQIPSTVDGTSVLGGTSDLTAGSITSTSAITPNTYTAYTFGSLAPVGTPDLTPIIFARPSTVYNTTPVTVVVDVAELLGAPTSGTVVVQVTKDTKVSLSFDPGATTINGRSVQNNLWTLDAVSNPNYYIFTTSSVVPAGDRLSFGMSGTLTPGATTGSLTLSSVITGGSGGEIKVNNNTDADRIDYFQQ